MDNKYISAEKNSNEDIYMAIFRKLFDFEKNITFFQKQLNSVYQPTNNGSDIICNYMRQMGECYDTDAIAFFEPNPDNEVLLELAK